MEANRVQLKYWGSSVSPQLPRSRTVALVILFSAMSWRAMEDMVVYLAVSSCNYSLNLSTVGPAGKPSWMAFSTIGANLDKVR